MDARQLYVSNYIREISVPFSEIIDVRQNRWINYRPITIYFRDATEFGGKATFMPKWRIQVVLAHGSCRQRAEAIGGIGGQCVGRIGVA